MTALDHSLFEKSEIAQFYKNKTIFLTGATGFLGQCLVEKLLRSCPDLKHVYFLIRGKGKYCVEERKKRYFSSVVFDSLRKVNPKFEEKVTPIEGELTAEDLGLSEKDRNILKNETNIMYHNAANVKFDIKISLGLKINVLGTKYMLDLAQECKNLEIFIYVSTAYAHCYNKKMDDKFYPSPATLDDVYDLIEKDMATENGISEKEAEKIYDKYINIYCYTKAISEDLVRQYSLKNLNCAYGIYRPSVVISASKEPAPGYTVNTRGPVILFLGVGLGVLHAFLYKEYPIDFIPSDYAINILIALTRDCFNRWKIERQALVYNYGSTTVNPTNVPGIYKSLRHIGWTDGTKHAVWMNCTHNYHNLWSFWIANVLFHFIPACILDLVLIVTGKKPKAVSMFVASCKHIDKMDYFANGNWLIKMPKALEIIEKMNPTDKELFYSDLRDISWDEYSPTMWRGFKKYILKEDLDDPAGPRKFMILYFLHHTILSFIIILLSYFLLKLFNFL